VKKSFVKSQPPELSLDQLLQHFSTWIDLNHFLVWLKSDFVVETEMLSRDFQTVSLYVVVHYFSLVLNLEQELLLLVETSLYPEVQSEVGLKSKMIKN